MICRHRIGFFLYLTGLLLSSLPSHVISDDADSQTVSTPNLDVRIVSKGGFGCKSNLYSWSMETYKGKVYVGTNNNRGGAFGLRFFIAALPLRIFTNGGQIHRGTLDPDTGDWTWEEVVRDGLTRKNNYGVRKMKAVGDWLYAVTGNHSNGFEVWGTNDGENWEKVSCAGFGTFMNTSGRGLAAFKNHLYVGTENRWTGAQIWRREIDDNGEFTGNDDENDWERVLEKGVDDNYNIWFSDFEVHDDGTAEYLYAGTFNRFGSTLWRTLDGKDWENVFKGGNGNENDEAVMKLTSYDGLLYLGTSNIQEGATLLVSTDQSATDFTPLMTEGNGNTDNTFVWYIEPYEGRLYVSFLHSGLNNEFSLFSSDAPEAGNYTTETEDSFGIAPNTIGIRSMAVLDGKLLMGTAAGSVPAMVIEGTARIADAE